VYLRPTAAGLTVVSLDPSLPAIVGVGGHRSTIRTVPPGEALIRARATAYRAKTAEMTRRSDEDRFVSRLVRSALGAELALPGGLWFLHHELRLSREHRIDLLAIDPDDGQLVVVEAKRDQRATTERHARGRTAEMQAAGYARALDAQRASMLPCWQRLATALFRLYGVRRQVVLSATRPARHVVWSPDSVPQMA
jgi:hypothetical protein